MPTPTEIRQQITAQIVAALENNLLPWRRPWTTGPNSGRPENTVSRRAYSGINPILLQMASMRHGFTSKFWATFTQWQEIGGQVSKRPDHVQPGQWGTQIVFYRPLTRTFVNQDTGESEEKESFLLRTYTVFNADQVEGKAIERFKATMPVDHGNAVIDFSPIDEIVEGLGVLVRHGGDEAFYARPMPEGSWPTHTSGDYIQLPHRNQFTKPGSYYQTLAHELGHFSEVRTGYDHRQHGYAFGELVAELSASFVSSQLGLEQGEPLENHAAYVKHWLEAMKGDSTFIFRASTQASKTADFLLSFVKQPEPVIVA